MPNHCENDLTIRGSAARVDAVLAHIRGQDDPRILFDFNTLIRMPALLENGFVASGVSACAALFARVREVGMGATERSKLEGPSSRERVFHFMTQFPAARGIILREKVRSAVICRMRLLWYGHSDWYSWAITNWGTKWNAYDFSDLCRQEKVSYSKAVFSFSTAWSPPIPVFVELVARFPKCQFRLAYYEAGVGFKGKLVGKRGTIVEQEEGEYRGSRGG